MLVVANRGEGEFRHIGLADDDRAGLPQPAHDDGILQGGLSGLEYERAGRCRLTGDIEQILDRDDGAVERPERHPGLAPGIGGIRRRSRRFGIELREHTFLTGTGGETRKDGFQMIAD